MTKSKVKSLFLAVVISTLTISFIIFPEQVLDASVRGLHIWWEIVFPSLLPFLIISELLIAFGVVNFISVLLEPFMGRVFRVPGSGGFVWAMGMASGFPTGAMLTSRLRNEGALTKIEAERLITFTNSTNPLFIFGAVAVGFFNNYQLGILLAAAHYLSNFTVGFFMRFYKAKDKNSYKTNKRPTLKRAFGELHKTRVSNDRTFGQQLNDAVISATQTLLMIGGLIILFSVVNKVLFELQITLKLSEFLNIFFSFFSLSKDLSIPLIAGLFEISLGSQLASQVVNVPLKEQAMITSFILAFSGISVQAQVASVLSNSDISFKPYFYTRFLQAFIAGAYTFILWKPIYLKFLGQTSPELSSPVAALPPNNLLLVLYDKMTSFGPLLTILSLIIYILAKSRQLGRA